MGAVQILIYFSALFFVVAVVVRALHYARTPVHMRWELYPVAHEKGRAHYGGSIFEESEWWTKPRQIDHVNELREMAAEILLLKGVRLHNRRLWAWSFPFHLGVYLLIGWLVLLLIGAVTIPASAASTEGWRRGFALLIAIAGFAGLGLTLIGALGLLLRRLGVDEMRKFNAPADYFNLLFFIVVVAVALAVQAGGDAGFTRLRAFLADVIALRPAAAPTAGMALEVVLASLLIAWMPLTRMFHFVAKYFLYHEVRWSDDPNPRGGRLEARLVQALNYGVSWRGPHIQSGKSWAEVATEDVE
jgi:nitrate reductase gamma subunit